MHSITRGQITTKDDVLNTELICVQFRKVLELIAYSSLTANKERYPAAHMNFGQHWRAKDMLSDLRRINPRFYPIPLEATRADASEIRRLVPRTDGFLTEDDFAVLYDTASDVLHMRNPFSTKQPDIQREYPVEEWVSRIQKLVEWHVVHLVNRTKWIAKVPHRGDVEFVVAHALMTNDTKHLEVPQDTYETARDGRSSPEGDR